MLLNALIFPYLYFSLFFLICLLNAFIFYTAPFYMALISYMIKGLSNKAKKHTKHPKQPF